MNTGRALSAAALGGIVILGAGSALASPYRTYDGTGNNPNGGNAGTELIRLVAPSQDYIDDSRYYIDGSLPNARVISNTVFDQDSNLPAAKGASNFLFQWGQFLDHDIDLSHTDPNGTDDASMITPINDPDMPPFTVIPFTRSEYSSTSGVAGTSARQQINSITAFIDGSNVYGSNAAHVDQLRRDENGIKLNGGMLATSGSNLLPTDTSGSFVTGDERANEQIGLTSMHTLFMREHNYWAARIMTENPGLDPVADNDYIFEEARKRVGAELQAVTYNEFLPVLMGSSFKANLGAYSYDANIDPSIANEFSTAAYRVGHTMLPNELAVLNEDGSEAISGGVALADAFFTPQWIKDNGIEGILRGLASTDSQEIDNMMVDGVRNMLFAMPGFSFGLDLAALNIQRGRDHGMPTYNEMRAELGLTPVVFGDGTLLADADTKLASVYADEDDIDLWVGLLSEAHFGDAMIGETTYMILFDQFQRLMNGDLFWYENDAWLSAIEIAEIGSTKLSDIILRNTDITWMQEDVFLTVDRANAMGNENSVPEPTAFALMALALAGLSLAARRRRGSPCCA